MTARRIFSILPFCIAAYSPHVADPHLPEPAQADYAPAPIAAGMVGLATFSGDVLVLSSRRYPLSREDPLSAVSPVDLAVAWGPSARSDVHGEMSIWQVNRRYAWRVRASRMARPEIRDFMLHSGNWHMIPASPEVERDLARVRKGDVVRIEGDLVQVSFDGGMYFKSSLVRDDTGDGACEIIRVRSIVVERT